jgi:hypothetical protein
MPKTPNASEFATSMLHLLQRFTGNQPDALSQTRVQVENELLAARQAVARAEAQLEALDQLQTLIDEADRKASTGLTLVPVTSRPPLKRAIVLVLDEEPSRRWHRRQLYAELVRRGWGPGGTTPKNTFTSRLRDLEKEKPPRIRRHGRDHFQSIKNEEVPA